MAHLTSGDSPEGASARLVTVREAGAIAAAFAGEVLLVALSLNTHIPASALLAAHGVIVLACGAVLFARRPPGCDLAFAYVIVLLVAISGPAGLLPLMASLPFARMRDDRDAVAAWYERLARAGKPSSVTQTYERIVSGRVHLLDSALPANFLEVIRTGGMEERQRALGLIARRFHPDYTAVLEAALRSPEPVVRVQAAAVVARVREDLKLKIAQLAQDVQRTPVKALADAGELRALQGCSLVADAQRIVCREAAQRLLRANVPADAGASPALPPDRDALLALEDFLIAERRFKELRVLRRIAGTRRRSLRVIRRRSSPKLERAA